MMHSSSDSHTKKENTFSTNKYSTTTTTATMLLLLLANRVSALAPTTNTIINRSIRTTNSRAFSFYLPNNNRNDVLLPVSYRKNNFLFMSTDQEQQQQQQNQQPEGEKTEEEKAALKAAREARKEEKKRKAAEKKAKKAAEKAKLEEAQKIQPVTYLNSEEEDSYESMGDYTTVMSRSKSNRVFESIASLEEDSENTNDGPIWLRGRLQSIRVKGGSCFLVLRQDSFHTIQAVYFKDKTNPEQSQKMIKYLKSLTVESIIDIQGTLADADIKSCSLQTKELAISKIYSVAKAEPILPFLVEDAARSEKEVEESQATERPFPRLGQELRLDNRWMDLRAPANNAILRVQSAICQLFREYLYSQNFIEIHTPKLLAGESESGAGVFTTDYFGETACLAQSPQLYKVSVAMLHSLSDSFHIDIKSFHVVYIITHNISLIIFID